MVPEDDSQANLAVQKYIIDKKTKVVGLDCEWRSQNDRCYDVALIQVATEHHVILFQVCRFENEYCPPRKLADILQDKNVIKVGVGIKEDAIRIHSQFQMSIDVASWVDLRCFAIEYRLLVENLLKKLMDFELDLGKKTLSPADIKSKRLGYEPKLGLESLVAYCLGKVLPKSGREQVMGCWEAPHLKRDLELYAAADAAASLDVFNVLLEKAASRAGVNARYLSWSSVIKKPYDQKQVRLSYLELIEKVAPDWILEISPGYFEHLSGRSNRSLYSSREARQMQHEPRGVETTRGRREGIIKPVVRGLWYYTRRLCELVFYGFVVIFALIVMLAIMSDKSSK